MKKSTLKYILSGFMSLLLSVPCFAAPNPNVLGATVTPAPVVYPNGTATFQFQLNNDGSATTSAAVTVTISLSQLDFTGSNFNVNTDIEQTGSGTPFTWSYEASTKVLTATLNGNFAPFAANTFKIRNLNVLAASAPSNPTIGANVNVVAPGPVNSNLNDDNTNAYTYTTVVLPVGLVSFEAFKYGNCDAKLMWTSAEETNFDYYQLEQSSDSKTFTAVGNIQKNKGANSKYEQIAELKGTKNNTRYYRLKMVDLNNTIKYSKVASVQNECAKTGQIIIAPNPANDIITVKDLDSKGNMYIYDITGRLCLSVSLTELGNQEVKINHLIQGTYMIQIKSEQGTYNTKLVKQ